MPSVEGLRSPYAKIGRLVYFGRMLDKIRLHADGKLPAEYQKNLGENPAFHDARCCRFLGVRYEELRQHTLAGGSDEEILIWAHARGLPRDDVDCQIWNSYMMKIGWRDERSATLAQRVRNFGLQGHIIETSFDLIDFDEGRNPIAARSWDLRPPLVFLVSGVSGSGKTTVGEKLAAAIGCNFRDADSFHSAANVAKMASGQPLNDEDRAPWLAAIHHYIEQSLARGESAVVTCSALKEKYRQEIVTDPTRVKLIFLQGDFELLKERMESRQGHFMKTEMLKSQLATLEPPAHALTLDIAKPVHELIGEIRDAFDV